MSWNYRVVRSKEPDGSTVYTLREAYYTSPNDAAPHSITVGSAYPSGETLLELRKDVALMFAAFDKAPLNEESFEPEMLKASGTPPAGETRP